MPEMTKTKDFINEQGYRQIEYEGAETPSPQSLQAQIDDLKIRIGKLEGGRIKG